MMRRCALACGAAMRKVVQASLASSTDPADMLPCRVVDTASLLLWPLLDTWVVMCSVHA